jgi:hypothetical protein
MKAIDATPAAAVRTLSRWQGSWSSDSSLWKTPTAIIGEENLDHRIAIWNGAGCTSGMYMTEDEKQPSRVTNSINIWCDL